MLSTPLTAVRYLIDRGLLDPASIVDGDLILTDRWSRNRCLLVRRATGSSYFLKQELEADGPGLLLREAAVYRHLQSDEEGIGQYLPACYGYDPEERLLVVELVGVGETLRSHQRRRNRCSILLARAAGDALACLHRSGFGIDHPGKGNAPLPWVFSIHQPNLPALYGMSALSMELTRMIQSQPELCARLEEAAGEWRPRSLIHHDMKWDNIIVVPRWNSGRAAGLRIVDWEGAGLGDPCWDTGSFLSEYLAFWLSTAPLARPGQPQPSSTTEDRRLQSMQLAVGAFWHEYVSRLCVGPEEADRLLARAVSFAAVRLLQTAFETTQLSAQLSGVVVLEVQLAANMLQRPVEAAVGLLGFPLEAFVSP